MRPIPLVRGARLYRAIRPQSSEPGLLPYSLVTDVTAACSRRRASVVRARPISVVGRSRSHSQPSITDRASRPVDSAEIPPMTARSIAVIPPMSSSSGRLGGRARSASRALAKRQRSWNRRGYQGGKTRVGGKPARHRRECRLRVRGVQRGGARNAVREDCPGGGDVRGEIKPAREGDLACHQAVGERSDRRIEAAGGDDRLAPENRAAGQDPVIGAAQAGCEPAPVSRRRSSGAAARPADMPRTVPVLPVDQHRFRAEQSETRMRCQRGEREGEKSRHHPIVGRRRNRRTVPGRRRGRGSASRSRRGSPRWRDSGSTAIARRNVRSRAMLSSVEASSMTMISSGGALCASSSSRARAMSLPWL